MKKRKMVPPDGGWGWLIVLGSCLINMSTIAILPSFGLLFGGFLMQLGANTTDASLIISTTEGIMCFSGIMLGPLLKIFTYRKVAIIGGVISTSAILLTGLANSLLHTIITFGVLGGIGLGLSYNCTMLGVNNYFSKRKGQAIGLAMTGTVVGFMLMPQIVRLLLDEYGFRPSLLILGALSLHALVGSCLFQPVSWHLKSVLVEVEEEEEAHNLLSTDKGLRRNRSAAVEIANGVRSNVSSPNIEERNPLITIASRTFLEVESLAHDVSPINDAENIFREQGSNEDGSNKEADKVTNKSNGVEEILAETNVENKSNRRKTKTAKSCLSKFSKFMDLDLLRDGVYLNIVYGISILSVSEVNFKLILPFFLSDLGFTNSQIASALSSMAISDISSRLVVPPILDRITLSWRTTFVLGSISVALIRSFLALQKSTGLIITTLVILGFFRGISLISCQLVLTEYSTGNNFPSVLGLCTVIRAIFIGALVPLCGYIRDVTNSYPLYIHSQTLLMTSVVIAWIVEIIILKSKNYEQENTADFQTEN